MPQPAAPAPSITAQQPFNLRLDKRHKPDSAAQGHDPSLWAVVSPRARWRRCNAHGLLSRPLLRATVSQGAGIRIEAQCPACGRFLGFMKKRRVYDATVCSPAAA